MSRPLVFSRAMLIGLTRIDDIWPASPPLAKRLTLAMASMQVGEVTLTGAPLAVVPIRQSASSSPLMNAQIINLIVQRDLKIIDRKLETRGRGEDKTGGESAAGFRLQVAVAGAVDHHSAARIAAIADIFIGFFGAAQIIVIDAARHITGASENIMQIGCAERRAIGGTQQHHIVRSHFNAAIIGEFANIAPGKTKGVITPGTCDRQEIEKRHTHFTADSGMAAFARTVTVLPAEIIVGKCKRIGVKIITLLPIFGDGCKSDRSGWQLEQFGVGDASPANCWSSFRDDRLCRPKCCHIVPLSARYKDALDWH